MAALACAVGLDGMSILTTDDPVLALVTQAVSARAAEIRADHDGNLARLIRNEIADAFK